MSAEQKPEVCLKCGNTVSRGVGHADGCPMLRAIASMPQVLLDDPAFDVEGAARFKLEISES